MRQYLLLFKTLYKAQNSKPIDDVTGKKKLSKGMILALCCLPMLVLIAIVLVFLTMSLQNIGEVAVLSNAIVSAVQMMTLFLSLSSIITTLYSGKDTPLLNNLPIKPSKVFFAKFSLLYVNTLKLSSVIIVPLLLTVSITFNVVSGSMFYGIYPLIFVIALVVPILPLFVVTLFSMPIAYIGSFLKGKAVLKSIISILSYALLMAGYMVFIYFANTTDFGSDDIQMSQSMLAGLTTFSKVLYPNKVLINFCFGIDAGKNFGISFAITIGTVVVTLLLAMFSYRRINIRSVEGTSQSSNDGEISLKQSKIVPSLIRRDFKMIFRNSKLAMSSFANFFMAPMFIVVMYFVFTKQNASGGENALDGFMLEMMLTGFALMMSMIFLAGANMLANIAYTREGASFFASKALPIKPADSIKSKLILACIVAACIDVVVMLIMLLLLKMHIVSVIIAGIDIMLVVVGVTSLSILFDMRNGNQYWKDASELRSASKGNMLQIISALIAIVPGILIMMLGVLLSMFASAIDRISIMAIYWSVATIVSAIVCVIGIVVLKTQGEKCYEMIGEHKVASNHKNRQKFKGLMR